ncbi:MAG: MATE family efflux transporter, partial [Clostridiales bacterium]|nr:MATE family efflux transporter [Clostridiales bacterium]
KGNIWKQLVSFSIPIMLTNLLQVSYQFVDSLWIGNLIGANALGAVAVASTVIFVALSFIIGINNATLTILSQQKGMQDEVGLTRYLNAFVVLLAILALIATILGFFFAETVLKILNTPTSMINQSKIYLQINSLGVVFLIGYNFIGTVMRALGDSKTPLKIVSAAVVLNAILDPIFIAYFNLGVYGAALATIIAQGLSFIAGLYFVLKRKLAPFSIPSLPAKEEILLILKLGIPSGLQMSVISAGIAAIMSVVNSFGAYVVAGFSAAQRLDSIIMLPAQALGTAVNSMAGQNIGVNRWDRVYRIDKYALIYNLLIMFLIALLIFIFAEQSLRLFIQEPSSLNFGKKYLQTIAFFYPFLGINFILNGTVRASGAMYQVLALNIISFWALRYPLTFIFSSVLGDSGIALGMGSSFVISSIVAYLYYRYGGWRRKRLFL